jgi:stage II sporulation protein R
LYFAVHTGIISVWTVFFMKKILKLIGLALFLWAMVMGYGLLRDKGQISNQLVRLHVVANSDAAEDQAVKLQVRDAVVAYLNEALADCRNVEQVKAYLSENLQTMEAIAKEALSQLGLSDDVAVSFEKEAFPIRHYDTFSLPSGVYQSLRIRIGNSQGHNWWCVVFPTLCIPQTEEGFQDVAAGSGFSESLTNTLTGEEGYEVRFLLLDLLGMLENILTGG